MVMDTTPAIVIVAPILAPIVTSMGVNAVHFGIIVIVNLGNRIRNAADWYEPVRGQLGQRCGSACHSEESNPVPAVLPGSIDPDYVYPGAVSASSLK